MNPPAFSRVLPAGTLGVIVILLALHHWYAVTSGSVYASVVLFVSMFGGLAAGGTVYPPLFYALGSEGRHLPFFMKAIGGLCMAGGLAVGGYLLFVVYGF